ncbi:MAG: hypothetical protein OXT70_06385 [Chloroflexota bacterium]|nr:hypothetical protein [Chloroflexota bacterium]
MLDVGQVEEQEAQFASGGDVALVLFGLGVGIGEEIELVGETVGGDGAEDVVAVEPEVAEIGVDGGAGASE